MFVKRWQLKDEVKLNLLTLRCKKKALRFFFFHFISFETVLIYSLRCSGPPSVLGLALNLVTSGIIGMCLSYCTDPSWRRQGNGLIFFTAPCPRAPLLLPCFFFFFFYHGWREIPNGSFPTDLGHTQSGTLCLWDERKAGIWFLVHATLGNNDRGLQGSPLFSGTYTCDCLTQWAASWELTSSAGSLQAFIIILSLSISWHTVLELHLATLSIPLIFSFGSY